MELLAVIFLWPFIILAAGLVFIVVSDIFPFGLALAWIMGIFILGAVISSLSKTHIGTKEENSALQIFKLRRTLVTFSIALLFPVFIRYLADAFLSVLPIIILCLLLTFGFLVWGLFVRQHRTIMIANMVGGAIALFYLYVKIWELGEGPRVIAAGFGLVLAVTVSIIKLREKLV